MNPVISVENLTRRFGETTVVEGLSFDVEKGSIFGFLGPNGSGKTTVMRILAGLLRPSGGRVEVLGRNVAKEAETVKRSIGYMSQHFSLYGDLTVRENLTFYAKVYGIARDRREKRMAEVVETVSIGDYLNRQARHLSGGWKQRLALGCAMLHQPTLLFLDEPTAGIDPVARRELWDLLFELSGQGVTFFVSTHYMDEAERCSRVGYLHFGNLIACDTPDRLKRLPDVQPEGATRYEVRCPNLVDALRHIRKLEFVEEATIFAGGMHVLVRKEPGEQLRDALQHEGFDHVEISEILPTLEDVFVTLTRRRKQEAPHV